MATPARAEYAVRFTKETERRFLRYRTSVRTAIRVRLDAIAAEAAGNAVRRLKPPRRNEPPLRFYVYDGYRVVYQVDEATRRVVILDLAAVPA
jgi:mRNA-degrading endonuclease RelE of RelBE toxin-antitoxin system